MPDGNGLTLEWRPAGKQTATVTARLNGDVLACETITLTKHKNRADFASSVCAGRAGIDMAAVEAELLKMAAEFAGKDNITKEGEQPERDHLISMPEHVRISARKMAESGELVKRIVDDIAALGVAGERELGATLYLLGTSRLLDNPLSAIVQGPTASGKSYVIEKTSSMFPAETVVHATQMTPQALFHMKAGSLRHKWIVGGERSRREDDDTAEATRALREMLSSGRLVKLMPVKQGGEIVTVSIEQDGPIAYSETTTLGQVFDEDANRCLLLYTDEQQAQTRRIIDKLAKGYGGRNHRGDIDSIIERHHAFQRILQRKGVVVPYAVQLGELVAADRVEARRAFPQLMSMIQASALLHQFQRQLDGDGRLVATQDDYKLARHLLLKPLGRMLGGQLSDPAARFLGRLRDRFGFDRTFSKKQASLGDSASKSACYGWLSELIDVGLVEQVEPGRGRQAATWQVVSAADCGDGVVILPGPEKLFPQ
jgi:hypothetical protein